MNGSVKIADVLAISGVFAFLLTTVPVEEPRSAVLAGYPLFHNLRFSTVWTAAKQIFFMAVSYL